MENSTSSEVFVFHLNGYQIFSDESLLIVEEKTVELTWKARLLSWPWRPWKGSYVIKFTVADPKVYRKGNKMVAHPYTVTKMSQAIIDKIGYEPENS